MKPQTPIVVLVKKPPPILTHGVTIYFSLILALGFFWRSSFVLLGLYVLISALMIYKWHRGSDLCLYFTGFVLGPLGEIVPVYVGAWTYSGSPYLIPIWLPFLWGIVALSLKKLCEQFTTIT